MLVTVAVLLVAADKAIVPRWTASATKLLEKLTTIASQLLLVEGAVTTSSVTVVAAVSDIRPKDFLWSVLFEPLKKPLCSNNVLFWVTLVIVEVNVVPEAALATETCCVDVAIAPLWNSVV